MEHSNWNNKEEGMEESEKEKEKRSVKASENEMTYK